MVNWNGQASGFVLGLNGLQPAKGQEELASILDKLGQRVEAFFRDFHNTTSQEEIHQEILHRNGLRRNRHSYSDFHLFGVESKILATSVTPEGP